MNFFSQCKTKDDAKAVYRRLAKAFHPDKGGEAALMMELQKQFDEWQPQQQHRSHSFNFSINGTSFGNPPFDHPIHNEIRQLKGENTILKNEIYNIKNAYARELEKSSIYFKKTLDNDRMIIERDNEIIRLCKALDAAKKAPLPTFWKYIKERFYAYRYLNEKSR